MVEGCSYAGDGHYIYIYIHDDYLLEHLKYISVPVTSMNIPHPSSIYGINLAYQITHTHTIYICICISYIYLHLHMRFYDLIVGCRWRSIYLYILKMCCSRELSCIKLPLYLGCLPTTDWLVSNYAVAPGTCYSEKGESKPKVESQRDTLKACLSAKAIPWGLLK